MRWMCGGARAAVAIGAHLTADLARANEDIACGCLHRAHSRHDLCDERVPLWHRNRACAQIRTSRCQAREIGREIVAEIWQRSDRDLTEIGRDLAVGPACALSSAR